MAKSAVEPEMAIWTGVVVLLRCVMGGGLIEAYGRKRIFSPQSSAFQLCRLKLPISWTYTDVNQRT
jgi:hypothetical protein